MSRKHATRSVPRGPDHIARVEEKRRRRAEARERAEAERLVEARIQERLHADPRRESLRGLSPRLRSCDLIEHLTRVAPRLLDRDRLPQIETLDRLRRKYGWIRPAEAWRPRGRSAARQWDALIDHLLLAYPIPPFLRHAMLSRVRREASVAIYIGRGGSLRRAQREGRFTSLPRFTKREMHLLLASRERDFWRAIRRAQLEALGADESLIGEILESLLTRRFRAESRVSETLHWLHRHHRDIRRWEFRPLFDFLSDRLTEDRTWRPGSRTSSAMRRRMQEWHHALGETVSVGNERFRRSGISSARIRDEDDRGEKRTWSVEELLSAQALHAEGKELGHCVYAYCSYVRSGACSIWSLRCEGRRALTIEVMRGAIVQARGRTNRPPKADEARVLSEWASRAGLRVRSY